MILDSSDANERLLEAVDDGDVDGALAALENGADPNSRYDDGETVLGVAVTSGVGQVVNRLLSAGAAPNAKLWHHTPLYWAVRQSRFDLVQQLLSAGARVVAEILDDEGTSVHKAAEQGNVEMLRVLLNADGACALNPSIMSNTPRLYVLFRKGIWLRLDS